ncbi:MAG: spondin domain-containing protein [Verrucomicrobiota bacterium]
MKTLLSLTSAIFAATTLGLSAQTTLIEVRFNALGPTNYAPLAAVFHDGSYDIFDPGGTASAELETLAEVGNPGPLLGAIPGTANGGTNAGPTFSGGFTTFQVLVDNTNTFFNFASMVLPTNDWFIGNPNAIDVSSLVGAAFGTTLTITPPSVWTREPNRKTFSSTPRQTLPARTILRVAIPTMSAPSKSSARTPSAAAIPSRSSSTNQAALTPRPSTSPDRTLRPSR